MKKIVIGLGGLLILVLAVSVSPQKTFAEQSVMASFVERVQNIIAQISDLQQDIFAATKGSNMAAVASVRLTKTLQRGDEGEQVEELQRFLAQDPTLYPEGEVTGFFGDSTKAAVIRFQERHGLDAVGVVGPKTRAKIAEVSRTGSLIERNSEIPDDADVTEEGVVFKKGEIIVKLTPGTAANNPDKVFKRYGLSKKETIKGLDIHVISVPEGREETVRDALSNNPNIEFVELNEAHEPQYVPNDPQYPAWHHTKMHSEIAWDIARPASSTQITIAMADSGFSGASHPDLAANVVPGWNTVLNNTDLTEESYHGTPMTGVAAAIGDNNIGVAGMAYSAKIMPIKITNQSNGWAYGSDIAEAYVWAIDHGARVVNNSYQVCGGGDGGILEDAARYVRDNGGLVVVSAGNEANRDTWDPPEPPYVPIWPDSPARICVGATDQNDNITEFSSYGDHVDVSAPGTYVTTVWGSGYGWAGGTSASAPLVSGIAALIWGINPDLTPDQVEQIIESTATDRGATGWDQYYGWGRADAGAALTAASQTSAPAPDTTNPTVSISAPQDGSTVSGTVSITVSASDNDQVAQVELRMGSRSLGVDSSAPYTFSWDTTNESNGNVSMTAIATDASGNEAASAAVDVTVENLSDTEAPVVAITSPAEGETIGGKFLSFSSTASDNVGVAEIVLSLDGNVVGTCSGVTKCDVNVRSRKISDGSHTIKAVARDARGNESQTTVNFNTGSVSDGGGSTDPEPTTTRCTPGAKKKGEC
ncbi:MAG: S8 family serine peptidase [Nitrosomonadaceae bacterium]